MRYFLKHITQFNLPIALLLSVGCLGFWVSDCLSDSVAWGQIAGTLIGVLLNALVLTLLIYQRGITRQVSGLPFVLYLLVISTIPLLHTQWMLQIVILAFQLILLLVMGSYRQDHAVEPAFLSAILLCTAALFLPDLIFLLPIVWLMFAVQRAISLRVWLASLIGAVVVLIYVLLMDKLGWGDFVDISDIWMRGKEPISLIHIVVCVVGLFFSVANLIRQNIENTSITVFVWCLIMAVFVCAICMFFPPAYFASLFIVALYCLITLAVYFFASRESVFAGIVFLLFIGIFVGLYWL